MLTVFWSFIMPLSLAITAAVWVHKKLFVNKKTIAAIYKAREVIMTESEAEKFKENNTTRLIMNFISRIQKILDLDSLIIRDMRNMFTLMGVKKRPEKELANYVIYGVVGGLPILIVPFITGFWGYIVAYPAVVGIIIYQQYSKLKMEYRAWQTEITKDIPELIDKLRISFASGRDHISAFVQAKENSGYRMRIIIDQLINDFQSMRPAQALDLFSAAFKMPVINKFASAVKIAIEHGPESAENYFKIIETDVIEVRRVAIEELTKSKPEKVYQLYIMLITMAIGALGIKAWEIFSQVSKII